MRSDRFEKYFRDTVDLLDSIGLDFFLHGSTLLGKIRTNELLQREEIINDKELNFGVLAKDLTPDKQRALKTRSKYYKAYNDKKYPQYPDHLIFFSSFGPIPDEQQWDLPGFSLIAKFWEGKTKVVEYMGNDIALVWDKDLVIPKSEWETVELLGKKVKAPHPKEKWLIDYFGQYMEEDKMWHYHSNSLNRRSFQKLLNEGEL